MALSSEAAEGFFQFAENPEQVPALVKPEASLAILPAGTGDDFARGLMGRRESLVTGSMFWSRIAATETAKLHDKQMCFTGAATTTGRHYCLNASTMGIGGETAARVAQQGKFMRSFSGEARFAAAAMVARRWRGANDKCASRLTKKFMKAK